MQVSGARIDTPYPWGALWCLLPETVWPWRHELRQRYRLAREMAGLLPGAALKSVLLVLTLRRLPRRAW